MDAIMDVHMDATTLVIKAVVHHARAIATLRAATIVKVLQVDEFVVIASK